jgi:murein DD-endopeptidase MepM/ murein hydrolase activator NlpD
MVALLLVGQTRAEVQAVELEKVGAEHETAVLQRERSRILVARLSHQIDSMARNLEEYQELAQVPFGPDFRPAGGGVETAPDLQDPDFYQGSQQDLAAIVEEKAEFWNEVLRARIDDKTTLLACTPSILPVRGVLTYGYAWRTDPFTKQRTFHRGLDIAARRGTTVQATADGVVTFSDWDGAFGRTVEINHGYGVVTRYAHLHRFKAKRGKVVRRGDAIGEVGSSGRATGPHVHYEVLENGQPVNPIPPYVLDEADLVGR